MDTSHVTKVSESLSEDLAQYGLVRAVAEKAAPVNTKNPNFFGMRDNGMDTELVFSKDIDTLVESEMDLALVAPENETFNMLLTKDFRKAVEQKDDESLRDFLRRLLDEV